MDDLPTWVADWSCGMLEKFENRNGGKKELFAASKGLKVHLRDINDDSKLGIQGIYLDTIISTTTGVVNEQITGIEEDLFGHGIWWMRARSLIGSHYPHTNETIEQALGRTRLGGTIMLPNRISGAVPLQFYEVKEDEFPTKHAPPDFLRLMGTVGTMTSYRVLATTKEKYMGLAPLTAEIGDEVFLLPGVETPFVLRRGGVEGEYEVIGQCYVHGVMAGERADERLLKDIILV